MCLLRCLKYIQMLQSCSRLPTDCLNCHFNTPKYIFERFQILEKATWSLEIFTTFKRATKPWLIQQGTCTQIWLLNVMFKMCLWLDRNLFCKTSLFKSSCFIKLLLVSDSCCKLALAIHTMIADQIAYVYVCMSIPSSRWIK